MRSAPVRTILWRNPLDQSAELCRLTEAPGEVVLEGVVVLPVEGVPARVDYRVEADAEWVTSRARVRISAGSIERERVLVRSGAARWLVDGEHRMELDGCEDVDVRVTPATNTLPIRRLELAMHQAVEVRAAWVGLPDLQVASLEQIYERVDERRYRYRSGDFAADLVVDDAGLVLRYGDRLWSALASWMDA
jgi:hypothetical protein